MTERSVRRELLVSKGWVQAVALFVLFGFFVLGLYLGVRYTVPRITMEEPEDILFTEIAEPAAPRER